MGFRGVAEVHLDVEISDKWLAMLGEEAILNFTVRDT